MAGAEDVGLSLPFLKAAALLSRTGQHPWQLPKPGPFHRRGVTVGPYVWTSRVLIREN